MGMRKNLLIGCVVIFGFLFLEGAAYLWANNPDKIIQKGEMLKLGSNGTEIQADSVLNLVLLGLDEEQERSDVMIVLNYNIGTGQLNFLSIPRDTKTQVRGRNVKMNAVEAIGGEWMVCEQLFEMTGLKIDYYLTMNFEGFRKIVDTLDGVDIHVKSDLNYDDPYQNLHIHLKKGLQHLDGEQAEQLVRYRKGNQRGEGYTFGDLDRIKVQQEFIQALITQKMKLNYLSKAGDLFYLVKRYVKTNIEIGDFLRLAQGIQKTTADKVKAFVLPGDAGYSDRTWYFNQDREKTARMIREYFFP